MYLSDSGMLTNLQERNQLLPCSLWAEGKSNRRQSADRGQTEDNIVRLELVHEQVDGIVGIGGGHGGLVGIRLRGWCGELVDRSIRGLSWFYPWCECIWPCSKGDKAGVISNPRVKGTNASSDSPPPKGETRLEPPLACHRRYLNVAQIIIQVYTSFLQLPL